MGGSHEITIGPVLERARRPAIARRPPATLTRRQAAENVPDSREKSSNAEKQRCVGTGVGQAIDPGPDQPAHHHASYQNERQFRGHGHLPSDASPARYGRAVRARS